MQGDREGLPAFSCGPMCRGDPRGLPVSPNEWRAFFYYLLRFLPYSAILDKYK